MEKRSTMLLTVIAIATLLVAVVGATFAYFATTSTIDANIPVNIETAAKAASFTAFASKDINITVDANEMQKADASETAQSNVASLIDGLTDSANLNVVLKAAAANQASTCTYDIVWTWTSDRYALEEATAENPTPDTKHYWPTTGITKEFTIEGTATATNTVAETTTTALTETNFDSSTFVENHKTVGGNNVDYIILVNDAKITVSDIAGGNVLWHFTVRFYNANKDQSALMGKNLSGTISVDSDSVKC